MVKSNSRFTDHVHSTSKNSGGLGVGGLKLPSAPPLAMDLTKGVLFEGTGLVINENTVDRYRSKANASIRKGGTNRADILVNNYKVRLRLSPHS